MVQTTERDEATPSPSGRGPDSASGSGTQDEFRIATPQLGLPKGGGAIRGIGEKFAANPVTGTGSLTVPLALSPGRSGFGPSLSLSYDSGAGNGPFGFGWHLSLPAITRKTDKGLPRYVDRADSDVFILSGAEDLVPVLAQDDCGEWRESKPTCRSVAGQSYLVRRYRPRMEGLFARIERWSNRSDPGDMFWRTISGDNVTTWYGRSPESRICDPDDPARIFTWLICESYDDRGNAVVYGYKAEDSARIFEGPDGALQPHAEERNRTTRSRTAQRYLKSIRYGNRTPYLPELRAGSNWPDPGDEWLFETVFDYGDHAAVAPRPAPCRPWLARADRFSTYRAGFEIRTYRTCQRILMFHHFPDEPGVGRDCLVRSTDFDYTVGAPDGAGYTLLRSVSHASYRRSADGYDSGALPPVEFGYSEARIQERLEYLDGESLAGIAPGEGSGAARWTDLHGEGLTGILTEQAGSWFYKRNLSPLGPGARFAAAELVASKPGASIGGDTELMDLAGDGHPDLVVMRGAAPGFYEHDETEGWQPFRPFSCCPNIDLRDPDLRLIDLNGDGLADLLITGDDSLVWHPSLAEAGFGEASRISRALDEEKGPRLLFSDPGQSIFLADMSGDGLTDLVRIRNDEVCYWPNTGYGRFGAKVTMNFCGATGTFDVCDQFDTARLRLADIDGSGTADIIYVHSGGVHIYFNRSGNGWSDAHRLNVMPRGDDATSIVALDLLGNGTACLVWWSPLAADAGQPVRYVDLMGGQKPHLLVSTANNMGAETRIGYAPSTRFYLQDRAAGRPWATRLPFPVHVVDRVEIRDLISRSRFVTCYAYHHGYFDPKDREFRGFGMVEQWDSEHLSALTDGDPAAAALESIPHIPPVYTRSWFHTGAYLDRGRISRLFETEYFRGATAQAEALLDDTVLPLGLDPDEEREACRALKGAMLRSEVYALDGVGVSPETPHGLPYSVTEQNFAVRCLQPRRNGRYGVFLTHSAEAIACHFERNIADPRIQHSLTLEVDGFGNVLKQASIAYGRQSSPLAEVWDRARQTTALVTYSESSFTRDADSGTEAIDRDDCFRLPAAWQSLGFELTDYAPGGPGGRYLVSDFVAPEPGSDGRMRLLCDGEVAFEDRAVGPRRRRRIACQRTLFRRDDLNGLLPPGTMQSRAIGGARYKLALTPGLIDQAFQRPHEGTADEALLPEQDRTAVLGGEGGYRDLDGNGEWWAQSGEAFFSAGLDDTPAIELAEAQRHFFLARRYRDPFGHPSFVDFDRYDLLGAETRDALGNRVTIEASDYRVLQPRLISDANRNRSEVAFDVLGMVAGTAVMGKPAPAAEEGDTLEGFAPDLTQDQRDALFESDDPLAAAPAILAGATSRIVYDVDRFRRSRAAHPARSDLWQPSGVATLARETHVHDALPRHGLRVQIGYSYSDGFGREIQRKGQAEPGPRPLRDAHGRLQLDASGQPLMDMAAGQRWIGSGWTVFNNKNKPVRKFEPFFSGHHRFEFDPRVGVSPVLFYDPVGRVIATLHPQGTYEKVVFDPWSQTTFDANDTCAPRGDETGDPRTDRDIAGFVASYFAGLPSDWKTWHARRIDGSLGPHEREAAIRAAAHADTPKTAHLDASGRPFLSIVRNRIVCPGHELDGHETRFESRVELDVQGRQRAVRDAIEDSDRERDDPLGRIVGRFVFDLLGNPVRTEAIDAGQRWALTDTLAQPIRAWDSRGHRFRSSYDALRRPLDNLVRGSGPHCDPQTRDRDVVLERIDYGDALPDAEALNLRTRVYRHCDGAGVAFNALLDAEGTPTAAFDFKGNLRGTTRRLVRDYRTLPDWQHDVALEAESFAASVRFDALNRPIQTVPPRSSLGRGKISVLQPSYSEANLLERLDVWLDRDAEPDAPIDPVLDPPARVGIAAIDYDSKGQRTRIAHRNGAETAYSYDPATFRLTRLITRRGDPGDAVQDLAYTYDPSGNLTHIADAAQQTVFFRNKQVAADNDYVYDALYRLIAGTGREQLGRCAAATPHAPEAGLPTGLQCDDGAALARYIEHYVYDPAGNVLQMRHRGADAAHPGWTRRYHYREDSRIEPGRPGNRLSSTATGDGPDGARQDYAHDLHGNIVSMPHLGGSAGGPNMVWDCGDNLRRIDKGGGGTAYYTYDSGGQRVRKIWEKSAHRIEERLYIGGLEIYRKHAGPIGAQEPLLERETLHVMDDARRMALVETRTLDRDGDDPAPARSIRYQLSNHLGSAAVELDDTAQVISYEEYSPFGSTTYEAVRNQTETPKRFRFTGKERDEESGFYYHGVRYYAPWLGRWTAADPAGFADGLNSYVYVRNNPAMLTDSTGAQCDPSNASCIDATYTPGPEEQVCRAPDAGPSSSSGSGSSALASGGFSAAGGILSSLASAAPSAAPILTQTTNSIPDLLTFLHAQAGFEAGAARPLNFTRYGASPFGTAAHAQSTSVLAEMQDIGFLEAERIFSEVRTVNGVVTQIGGTPGGPRGSFNMDIVVAQPGETIAVGDNLMGGVAESIGDLKYGGGVISPKYGALGSPLETINGRTVPGAMPEFPAGPAGMSGSARFFGVAGGAFNAAGGVFMLASIDTERDHPILIGGKVVSGGASTVGGGMMLYGAVAGTAGTVATGAAIAETGGLLAIPIITYEISKPRGWIAYDPQLVDRAIAEGRNPFCAQCHGPGGALDPNNDWNSRDPARRAAFANRLRWVNLDVPMEQRTFPDTFSHR